MTHFNAELWNIHQICVLQVLNEKKNNSSKKRRKLAKAEMSRHNFRMLRHNFIMSRHNFKVTNRSKSQQRRS